MDDGLELRVCQNPQQVVQDEEELGSKHVAVLDLENKVWRIKKFKHSRWFIAAVVSRSFKAAQKISG